MTDHTTTVPATPADRRRAWDNAVAEARGYLAETVHKIHPGLSARTLLRYVLKYRAHLATLAAACVDLAGDIAERAPCPVTDATARSEPVTDLAGR